MTEYKVIFQEFRNEFRNGSNFLTDPTDFSVDLKTNAGELNQVIQTVQIHVIINPDEIQLIQFNTTADATYGEFVGTGVNFINEGLYTGAVIDVFWSGVGPISTTVQLITGPGFNTIRVVKAALITAGITDGQVGTDFIFRLTSYPDVLVYKYGLNALGSTGTNYTGWYDLNEQAYFITNLTTSLQTMTPVGLGIISWNLSSVQAKKDGTVSTYFHQYTVEHIFRVPQYVEGEYTDIFAGTSPNRYIGTNTIAYDNGWFFGGTTAGNNIKAEIKGGNGNVGFYRESYNGFANNFEILNVAITNADNSGVFEGTVVNTVTFQVKNYAANFTSTSKLIIYHSKLPTVTEYENKPTAWATIWMFESLSTVASASPVSGTIITNFNTTVNADPTLLDVTADIQYTTDQQALILNGSNYLLWVSAGNLGALNPDNRVSLPVSIGAFSKNLDIPGLITSAQVDFYEFFDNSLADPRANWTGFNGDVGRTSLSIDKLSNIVDARTTYSISKVEFKIFATDGTLTGELLNINVPLGPPQFINSNGYKHQIINSDVPGGFNMPQTLAINRMVATSTIPPSASPTQAAFFRIGFQTPWRDWLYNASIPYEFYDTAFTNNNQNYKTSNYSNVNGFEVWAAWYVTMLVGGIETIYEILPPESNVYDFDTNDGTFTATTTYYDQVGNLTNNLYIDQNVLIKMDFVHALGTITLADIEAYMWIERDGSSVQPSFLHSSLDLTDPLNPLEPSQEVSGTNIQFVEIVSANNLVTIYCRTNRDNLQAGVTYNTYGRIKNKTVE